MDHCHTANQDLSNTCLETLQALGIPAFITSYNEITKGAGVVVAVNPQFLEVMASFSASSDARHYIGKTYQEIHCAESAELYAAGDFQALSNTLKPQRVDEGTGADVVKVRITEDAVVPALMLGFFVVYGEREQKKDNLDSRLVEAIDRLSSGPILFNSHTI